MGLALCVQVQAGRSPEEGENGRGKEVRDGPHLDVAHSFAGSFVEAVQVVPVYCVNGNDVMIPLTALARL